MVKTQGAACSVDRSGNRLLARTAPITSDVCFFVCLVKLLRRQGGGQQAKRQYSVSQLYMAEKWHVTHCERKCADVCLQKADTAFPGRIVSGVCLQEADTAFSKRRRCEVCEWCAILAGTADTARMY